MDKRTDCLIQPITMSVEILLSESSATGRQSDWVKGFLCQEDKNENLIPSYKREEAGYDNIATNIILFYELNALPIPMDIND